MRQSVSQALRAAKRKYFFTLAKIAVTCERKSGQLAAVDFQERQIDIAGDANNPCRDQPRARGERGLYGAVGAAFGEQNLNALGAVDHVGVGDDVAAGIYDEAGADCPLAADDHASGSVLAFF